MIPELKQFIEENIDLISDNHFNEIYNKIKSYKFTRLFTEVMLEADINPLDYMEAVPSRYLYESRLEHIDIPVGIIIINKFSFAGCHQLKEITIPEGVIKIKEGAFLGCDALEKLHLPSTLKYIDAGAFSGCKNLKEVTFAGTTKQWVAIKDTDGSLLQFEPVKCLDNCYEV